MALSTQPYKGARDFYPKDKHLQNYMFSVMRQVVESFGYEEYDAPMLEPLELYKAKTGEEIVNQQIYSFTDRGGREVAIRPEMTPTVSRMVAAKRQELAYPLRLFSIPNLWRYERPQRGRLREHWQLNVDLFGVEGIEGDIEVIQVADALMKAYGAKPEMYEIRVNSRKLLQKRIDHAGLKTELSSVIRIIDTYGKTDRAEVIKKLSEHVDDADGLLRSLGHDGSSKEVKELIVKAARLGIDVKPVETLARGFDYYTDIVFEVFDTNTENSRSIFGGGRYDGLVGLFGVDPVPTVGFGMGDVTLANFLETHGLVPDNIEQSKTDLSLLLIGDQYTEASILANELRGEGLNVSVDPTGRKIAAKIKSAEKSGVRYVLFVGESELKNKKYPLKDLSSGKEELLAADEIAAVIAR